MQIYEEKVYSKTYERVLIFNLIFSTFLLIAFIIIQFILKDDMHQYSVELIIEWENNSDSTKRLFKIFSGPLFFLILAVNMVFLYTMKDKKTAFNGLFLFYLYITLTLTLKNLYYETRPCFMNQEVSQIGCFCDFGNPSGHASGSFVIYFWLFYHFLFVKRNIIVKICSVILWAFCTIVTGLSRIQRGAHTIDQIIYGFLLGYFIISIYLIYEAREISKYFLDIKNELRKKVAKIFFLVGTIILLLQTINRFLVVYLFENKPYHPYDDYCKECFNDHYYMADKSYRFLLFEYSFPLIVLLMSSKKHIWSLNPNFYSDQFQFLRIVLFRLVAFSILLTPAILCVLINIEQSGYVDLVFCFIMGILFAVLFVLQMMEISFVKVKNNKFISKSKNMHLLMKDNLVLINLIIMKFDKLIIHLGISISIFIIWNSFYIVIQEQTMNWSINLTLKLIEKTPTFIHFIFTQLSGIFYHFLSAIAFFFIFFLKDKKVAFNGLILSYIKIVITHSLKIIFHDTRPCFVNQKISKLLCACDFGNPSGHSSEAFVMYFWLFYEFLYKKNGKVFRGISIILATFFILATGLSRIFFGAHFFAQVINGYSVGYICVCIYLIIDKYDFAGIIFNSNQLPEIEENISPQYELKKPETEDRDNRKKIGSILLAFGILIHIMDLLFRNLVVNYFEDNPYHPFQGYCDKCFEQHKFFSDSSFGWISFYICIPVYTFLLTKQESVIYHYNPNFYREQFQSWIFFAKRLIIFSITTIPLFILITISISNFFLLNISFLIIGIWYAMNLIYLQSFLLKKSNTDIQGDFFINKKCFQEDSDLEMQK